MYGLRMACVWLCKVNPSSIAGRSASGSACRSTKSKSCRAMPDLQWREFHMERKKTVATLMMNYDKYIQIFYSFICLFIYVYVIYRMHINSIYIENHWNMYFQYSVVNIDKMINDRAQQNMKQIYASLNTKWRFEDFLATSNHPIAPSFWAIFSGFDLFPLEGLYIIPFLWVWSHLRWAPPHLLKTEFLVIKTNGLTATNWLNRKCCSLFSGFCSTELRCLLIPVPHVPPLHSRPKAPEAVFAGHGAPETSPFQCIDSFDNWNHLSSVIFLSIWIWRLYEMTTWPSDASLSLRHHQFQCHLSRWSTSPRRSPPSSRSEDPPAGESCQVTQSWAMLGQNSVDPTELPNMKWYKIILQIFGICGYKYYNHL